MDLHIATLFLIKKEQMRRDITKIILVLSLLIAGITKSFGQDFLMQGWYWDFPHTCDGYNWSDSLTGKAQTLFDAGFTYVWLPAFSRTSSGSCSNGYDPKDLYDLGEYGLGATHFGTRTDVNELITTFNNVGLKAIADVIFNHRDGGTIEDNPAVKQYVTQEMASDKNPYPSDRFRCILPLSGNESTGDYYFKISSKTQDARFHNIKYKVYMQTTKVGWKGIDTEIPETEPNGGLGCNESSNAFSLGRNYAAYVDATGCTVDEFKLTLTADSFNITGDSLQIYLNNFNGNYSDHRIYEIWHNGTNIVDELVYQTWTDFTGMPSGQGLMNYENFSPNSGNVTTTKLDGFWDWPWWFYDYDQSIEQHNYAQSHAAVASTRTVLFDWTKWLWNDVGIRGYRMDAVKHFNPAFVGDLMDDLHSNGIDPGLVVGEFFDYSHTNLNNWLNDVYANMDAGTQAAINVRVFDFPLRGALKEACWENEARNVFNAGLADNSSSQTNPFRIVTFLTNHDTQKDGVIPRTNLAYAYLLTNNQLGLPCVYYPDYFGLSEGDYITPGFKDEIDLLIAAHKLYIYGANSRDYLNRFNTPYSATYTSGLASKSLIFQLSGSNAGDEVIVAINFDHNPLTVDHEVNMTNLSAGAIFTDILGRSNAATTTLNGSNQIHIDLPAHSYSIWVEGTHTQLPVRLVNFNVSAKGDYVELTWTTTEEENLYGFEIEKSDDGKHFKDIGFVKATTSPGEKNFYMHNDFAVPASGKIYYRLKSVNLDGSYTYSPVRAVRFIDAFSYKVFPNPTTGTLRLDLHARHGGNVTLRLMDTFGKIIVEKKLSLNIGNSTIPLDAANSPSGVFLLEVITENGKRFTEKIVKY